MITSQPARPSHLQALRTAIARFTQDRSGASFIEYIIVVGLVAIIAITAFTEFGDKVVGKLKEEKDALQKIKVSGGG
jgi:Flp pilus assembly pilin Flp